MATTKLDLDELERKAKAATPGQWQYRVPGRDCIDAVLVENEDGRQIADTYDNTTWPEQECVANGEHIAANSPPVTLTLIARIRELGAAVLDGARTIEGWVSCESQFDAPEDDPDWKQAQRMRELLTKGAVAAMSNPESVGLAVITEISAEMTRWHEDDLASEQECMRCRNSVHTPSDLEPTPLCDLCAQFVADHVPDLVASIAKLTAERDSLRAHVEAQDVRIKGLETRINPILEKGTVLP